MGKAWMLILSLIFSTTAFALVDMRGGNYADTFVDIDVPSSAFQLKLDRSYNSRTLFNGMLGFGWCSAFETRLETTAEANLKLTECGGGQELDYLVKGFDVATVDTTIQTIMAEVKKRNRDLDKKYLSKLENDLKTDNFLREEFSRQLNLKGKIKEGTEYYASGRENESLILKGSNYIRTLPDGSFQRFDLDGNLVRIYDRNGNGLIVKYSSNKIREVVDNKGKKLSFKYYSTGKVKQVDGPGGRKATYKYKGEDLVSVTNQWNSVFSYVYDDLHNLTQVNYPDKTFKAIKYNKDRDWVIGFTDRTKCTEVYEYIGAEKDSDTYKSTVVKTCNGKVTNRSSFAFYNKKRKSDGVRYLHKAESEVNGSKTEIVYHPIFGKPISIFRNKKRTRFEYFNNGLVKEKHEPLRSISFDYENVCNKVAAVNSRYYTWQKTKQKNRKRLVRKKKLLRNIKTAYKYESKKCNLIFAKNSVGQSVALTYDTEGRIASIKDQAKKLLQIKYDGRFGKPATVTRPGLGTISVTYKTSGEIDKIKSKQGDTVAVQVASIFNNLLDIIAPATAEARL